MTRGRRAALAAALLLAPALPALAEPMGADAFRALAEGWTLHFERDGIPYGSEQFFAGDRSLWRYSAEACEQGRWYAEAGEICFVYDTVPVPQCWVVEETGGRVEIRSTLAPPDQSPLVMTGRDHADLGCPGPRTGV